MLLQFLHPSCYLRGRRPINLAEIKVHYACLVQRAFNSAGSTESSACKHEAVLDSSDKGKKQTG